MSSIAQSGIDAAGASINLISSTIASQKVTGFKKSRFIFQSAVLDSNNANGVSIPYDDQQFSAGVVSRTESPLDIAITGDGFFAFSDSSEANASKVSYSRAGVIKVNADNELVDIRGKYLMASTDDLDQDGSDSLSVTDLSTVKVPLSLGEPSKTSKIDIDVNLPVLKQASDAKVLSEFDPEDKNTYNFTTKSNIFDSVGNQYTLTSYYLKPGLRRSIWNVKTKKAETGMQNVVVDCSHVFDRGSERHNSTAWAVFYEIDGVPVQPLNEDGTDVMNSSYNAFNTPYYANDIQYDDLYTKDPSFEGYNRILTIDNTDIKNGGRHYPNIDPKTLAADNFGPNRPYDYWRSHILYVKPDGSNISDPSDPVSLQPLGDARSKYDRTVDENKKILILQFDDTVFKPPFEGEIATVTFVLNLNTEEIPLSVNIQHGESKDQVIKKIQDRLTNRALYEKVLKNLHLEFQTIDANTIQLTYDDENDLPVDKKFKNISIKSRITFSDKFVDNYVNHSEKIFSISNFQPLKGEEKAWLNFKLYKEHLTEEVLGFKNDFSVEYYDPDFFSENSSAADQQADFVKELVKKLNKAIRKEGNSLNAEPKYHNNYDLKDYVYFEFINGNSFKLVNKNNHEQNDLEMELQIFKRSVPAYELDDDKNRLPQLCEVKLDSNLEADIVASPTEKFSIVRGGSFDTEYSSYNGLNHAKSEPVTIGIDPATSKHSPFEIKFDNISTGSTTVSFHHNPDPAYTHPKHNPSSTYLGSGVIYVDGSYTVLYPEVISSSVIVNEDIEIGARILHDVADQSQTIDLNYQSTTMYDHPFDVFGIQVNGNGAHDFVRVSIEDDGAIYAHYSDTSFLQLGMIPLVHFKDNKSLQTGEDGVSWLESPKSGDANVKLISQASGSKIQAFALEGSNIDMSEAMMDLIYYQNYYHANLEVLGVDKEINEAILKI